MLNVAITDLHPLAFLNAFRFHMGLPPTYNLISSGIYGGVGNSQAYQGNTRLSRNICALIPEELNCRLWITGLPPNCTVHELLAHIRGIGPVYACHINEPTITGSRIWPTSAASLTFFTADAANYFLACDAVRPFTVDGYVTNIVRHRIRTESIPVDGRSRVLRIIGNANIVQPDYLRRIFSDLWHIRFDTDYIRLVDNGSHGVNEIIWAFGSFRAQAHVIHMKINRYFANHAQAVYIVDPCVQGNYGDKYTFIDD
ncbi:hypothetical protein GQX73_g5424 [Xylaria multiplex]|uniref:RRM domain-containing protein n=1 Tax=Xylaria multiplex TaxID=323545 RepID=A0A7C8MU68_9PEZI|nr:hypothetical protein GQX73_g5424 [Xylaria multiplex]